MNEGHGKRLPWPLEVPDPLAKEVDLPQCVGMDLEKLAPSASAPPGAGIESVFHQDVLDGLPGDPAHAQFAELAKYPAVDPAGVFGNLNDQFSDNLGDPGTAFAATGKQSFLLTNPASEG